MVKFWKYLFHQTCRSLVWFCFRASDTSPGYRRRIDVRSVACLELLSPAARKSATKFFTSLVASETNVWPDFTETFPLSVRNTVKKWTSLSKVGRLLLSVRWIVMWKQFQFWMRLRIPRLEIYSKYYYYELVFFLMPTYWKTSNFSKTARRILMKFCMYLLMTIGHPGIPNSCPR